jgi:hypothetical protein
MSSGCVLHVALLEMIHLVQYSHSNVASGTITQTILYIIVIFGTISSSFATLLDGMYYISRSINIYTYSPSGCR